MWVPGSGSRSRRLSPSSDSWEQRWAGWSCAPPEWLARRCYRGQCRPQRRPVSSAPGSSELRVTPPPRGPGQLRPQGREPGHSKAAPRGARGRAESLGGPSKERHFITFFSKYKLTSIYIMENLESIKLLEHWLHL